MKSAIVFVAGSQVNLEYQDGPGVEKRLLISMPNAECVCPAVELLRPALHGEAEMPGLKAEWPANDRRLTHAVLALGVESQA